VEERRLAGSARPRVVDAGAIGPRSPEHPSLRNSTSHRLSEAEFRLLARAEPGHVFRPSDAEGEEFRDVVERLLRLRDRGLLRLEDGRIMKNQLGRVLMSGPGPRP
jgi:hypothetical protein